MRTNHNAASALPLTLATAIVASIAFFTHVAQASAAEFGLTKNLRNYAIAVGSSEPLPTPNVPLVYADPDANNSLYAEQAPKFEAGSIPETYYSAPSPARRQVPNAKNYAPTYSYKTLAREQTATQPLGKKQNATIVRGQSRDRRETYRAVAPGAQRTFRY